MDPHGVGTAAEGDQHSPSVNTTVHTAAAASEEQSPIVTSAEANVNTATVEQPSITTNPIEPSIPNVNAGGAISKEPVQSLSQLRKIRKVRLSACTRKMNDLKYMIATNENAENMQNGYEIFERLCDEFRAAHRSLQSVLSENERETDRVEWYEPRLKPFEEFQESLYNMLAQTRAEAESAQLHIDPQDSISNVNSKAGTKISTVSSAHRKAMAERAALLARKEAMKELNKLEQERLAINSKIQDMQISAGLAESDAKIKVLEGFSDPDGMNSYIERHKRSIYPSETEGSPIEYARIGTVPKTPLQRILQTSKQTRRPPASTPKEPESHTSQLPQPEQSRMRSRSRPRQEHGSELASVMKRQNDIIDLLALQHQKASLPTREIPVFDGNPLNYITFIRAFEYGIEEKTKSSQDRLYYLEQYTTGQPRELVRSCFHIEPSSEGYRQALSLLKENFGDDIKVTMAYMEKAFNWTNIKSDDGKALQSYALYLRSCCNAMQELEIMQELNLPTNIKLIMSKLPFKLRERWRTVANDILERNGHRARFKDLVTFMEKHSRILLDPLYGDIGEYPNKRVSKPATEHKPPKSKSFATSVAVMTDEIKMCSNDKPSKNDSTPTSEAICVFCEGKHPIMDCQKLRTQTHIAKVDFLKRKGFCFGCLVRGHMSKDCKKRMTCEECQGRHPTILHLNKATTPKESFISSAQVSLKPGMGTGAGRECALPIVPVQVKVIKGSKKVTTYAFLDPGSSGTFCTERLKRQLNAKGRKTEILLETMGQEKTVTSYELSGLEVGNLDGDVFIELPHVYTQNSIPVSKENMATQKDLARWSYLKDVKLQELDAEVELLIGVNAPKALEPWQIINSQDNGPYAVKTVFGWTVNGPLEPRTSAQPKVRANRISVTVLKDLLVQQYNHDFPEKLYEENNMSAEDHKFVQMMTSSITHENGHYYMPLPLRNRNVIMPNNRDMAKQRAMNLIRKFKSDETYALEYKAFMDDVIRKGYAEKVPESMLQREDGKVWYIPHHAVYHKRKKTIRVVFDCTSTYKGTSLNSELMQGPDLANLLIGVLLRFRQEPIAMMADIEGMFHQARVHKDDLDLLRFLWWPEGDTTKNLEEYRMTVHLFGAISSPTCATFALRKTADDNGHKFVEEVSRTVKRNFYVDDCLKSVATERQAITLCEDLRDLCSQGGFKLTKWISNSRAVLASIPEEHKAKQIKELDLDREKLPLERALGVQWNIESDTFTFKVALKDKPVTRRGILSVVSSVYDPLGFLAPFTLKAKQILQELCKAKCGWDDVIPEVYVTAWKRWMSEVEQLSEFQIDRCWKPKNFGQIQTAQLHHFCDGSEKGYGSVSYLRLANTAGKVHIAFLMGKARVTPLKQMTIPRLELAAATLAAKMDRLLRAELEIELEPSVFWTDSESVLKYIKNEVRRFNIYVANRTSLIRELSHKDQWRFIGSKENPADEASRGLNAEAFMKNTRWIHGPEFLFQTEAEWTKSPRDLEYLSPDDPEVRKEISVNTLRLDEISPTRRFIEYYSSWNRLKRAVGWMLKFKELLRKLRQKRIKFQPSEKPLKERLRPKKTFVKAPKNQVTDQEPITGLTVNDLAEAEKAIVCFEQERFFKQEKDLLKQGKSCTKACSAIRRLDPILDMNIMRVGGRLNKTAMPMEAKNPIILPKQSHISQLILQEIHQQVGHSGRGHMLSRLRQKFWIPCANSLARKVIKNCVFCRRLQARPGEQKMADLPFDRASPDEPPFTHVGVDYFGPIEVKRGRSLVKRYGVIFTCLVSRAVHLEVASYLDTASCINALRRFICRRGPVLSLRSDNGTNFIGTNRELTKALKELDHSKIQNAMLNVGVKWTFNPPTGAHHGGVWERLIRLVKKILTSVLKEQRLDEEALQTAFCEVEAIMNDRPITTVTSDPNDLEPLTPNHLLLLKTKPVMPPGLFQKIDLYSHRRWRQVQYIADLFWKRWTNEYLPLMQERSKWLKPQRNFTKDDLVLIMDDTAPRNSWLLGRIIETLPGSKGLVRSVRVRTKTNILERPVSKLCLLLEAEH